MITVWGGCLGGTDRTWIECSSGAHWTHRDAVPAVSLCEAARPFGYI
jgi:hypothetical protein